MTAARLKFAARRPLSDSLSPYAVRIFGCMANFPSVVKVSNFGALYRGKRLLYVGSLDYVRRGRGEG